MGTETAKKRPGLVGDIQVAGSGLSEAGLRLLAKNEPKLFMEKTQKLIDKGELRWSKVRDLRSTYRALADVQVPVEFEDMGIKRTLMASAFPLLSGGMTIAGINDAMMGVASIGQDLVTDMEDSKKWTTLARVTSEDNTGIDRVDETKDFPEIGAGEERFQIGHKRNGRRLSISKEMVEENDVAGIVQKVDALGEIAGELIEEQTLSRVTDLHGSTASAAEPYVLHLGTAGTPLYTATANSPGKRAPSGTRVTNNALADESDLENARVRLAAMLNDRGKRVGIPMSRCTLLVPDALVGVASKILNSELVPGVENEISNWGPKGQYRPRLVSSPKLDDFSTTAWYLGWFEKQFKRKWKLRLEYVTLGDDPLTYLRNRVAFQARIAWDTEVGAVDYNLVVQNLSGTTAPVPA